MTFLVPPAQLKVAPLVGGVIRTLADDARCCLTWGSDGFIYYQSQVGGINRVRAGGGAVEPVTDRDEVFPSYHAHFQVLPDSDLGVFQVWGPPRIVAQRLSTGERQVLVPGLRPFVTPTGHLLFASMGGQILAATFDAEAMELTNSPTPIVEGVVINSAPYPHYTVSESGDLLYHSGQTLGAPDDMVWVARDGVEQEVDPGWTADFSALRLSPDGTRLAITIRERGTDIWVKQLDQGPLSKLTFEPLSFDPSWTPDGTSVTFVSNRAGNTDIYGKRADGSAPAELILDHERPIIQPVWSPDGDWLVFTLGGPQSDLYGLQPATDSEPVALVADDQINESWPAISPDGRWLAYVSLETGAEQVYVRPFPNVTDAKWLVSTDGGTQPKWARSGQELFYRSATPEMVAVEILPGSTFTTGEHRVLFEWGDLDNDRWDVAPGDQRFVSIRNRAEDGTGRLILVQNFFEELKERVPN